MFFWFQIAALTAATGSGAINEPLGALVIVSLKFLNRGLQTPLCQLSALRATGRDYIARGIKKPPGPGDFSRHNGKKSTS
jgi:hypothetical protein